MQKKSREFWLYEGSLDEFQNYLLEEKESSPATIAKYKTDMKTFCRYLGDDRQVTKERLLFYKSWLAGQYEVSSANSMLAALNQYLEFMGYGQMKVKRLKVQTQLFMERERELSIREYRKLLDTARRTGKADLALMMESICATGIRISELPYITVEGVRQEKIRVNNKGKTRQIFLPDRLRKKLLYFIQRKGLSSGPVFVTRSGRPKDRSNIWNEMKRLAADAGVDSSKVFPHNLRHLFARSFYQSTGDLSGLADILGHSNLSVTRIYTKDSGVRFKRQINRLELVLP